MNSLESLLKQAAGSVLLFIVCQGVATEEALESFFEKCIDVRVGVWLVGTFTKLSKFSKVFTVTLLRSLSPCVLQKTHYMILARGEGKLHSLLLRYKGKTDVDEGVTYEGKKEKAPMDWALPY